MRGQAQVGWVVTGEDAPHDVGDPPGFAHRGDIGFNGGAGPASVTPGQTFGQFIQALLRFGQCLVEASRVCAACNVGEWVRTARRVTPSAVTVVSWKVRPPNRPASTMRYRVLAIANRPGWSLGGNDPTNPIPDASIRA